jgi:TonB-dependent SusC/RagA subfamily outer membrane receptor
LRSLLFGFAAGAVLLGAPASALAQTGSITGTVRDASTRRPVAQAQIVLAGTQQGALTLNNGRFLLENVPAGTHRLEVQLIGYSVTSRDVTVVAGAPTVADFDLSVRAIALDEVVVTGVGVAEQRRRLGASTATLSSTRISEAPVQTITETLTGRVVGVLPAPRGESGAAAPMRFRGQNSMTQRNDPIVYVDGIRIDTSPGVLPGVSTSRIDDINPQDIERIEVIKGAAAATLFGTEASSGVIQIFTKRGKEGPVQYSLTVDQEVSKVPLGRLPAVQTFDRANNRLVSNYPAEAIFRTGYRQAYNLSLSGGTPTIQYYASGRIMDDAGATRATGVRNMSLRTALDMNHGRRLRTSFGLNVIRNKVISPGGTFGYIGVHMLANPLGVDSVRPYGEAFASVEGAANDKHVESADVLNIDAKVTYQWTPSIASLLTVGHNQVYQQTSSSLERGAGKIVQLTGRRVIRNFDRSKLTLDFNTAGQLRLSEKIGTTLWVGGQSFFEREESVLTGVTNFPAPGLTTLGGGATISAFNEFYNKVVNAGVFTQAQLDVQNRLFITGGIRADGNSAFGEDFGLQTYPKLGVSYVVSDAGFWPGAKLGWDVLRLRAAYGTSGLQPGAFDAVRTFRPRTRLDNRPVIWAGNVGNPDLQPERSIERELGADIAVFNNRIGLEITYFWRNTEGAIMPRSLAPSLGFLEPQLVNLGQMESSGLEALANISVFRKAGFALSMTATAATLDQRVTDLGLGEGQTMFRLAGQGDRSQAHIAVGYQPGAQFGPVLDRRNPYRLTVPLEQLTMLNQIVPNTIKDAAGRDSLLFLGNPLPSFSGTFSTELSVPGNVRIRAVFVGATGFTVYNESSQIWYQSGTRPDVSQLHYELAQPSTTTERRQEIAEEFARNTAGVFGNWVFDGDYFRFQELAVNYRVPASFAERIGASSLFLGLAASNVGLWTRCECVADPGNAGDRPLNNGQRVLISTERFNAPSPRRLMLTLRGGW